MLNSCRGCDMHRSVPCSVTRLIHVLMLAKGTTTTLCYEHGRVPDEFHEQKNLISTHREGGDAYSKACANSLDYVLPSELRHTLPENREGCWDRSEEEGGKKAE